MEEIAAIANATADASVKSTLEYTSGTGAEKGVSQSQQQRKRLTQQRTEDVAAGSRRQEERNGRQFAGDLLLQV